MNPWKPTPARLKRLTYLLVFLTFDLILFGAFTRLTDSGLGCPDWPGCYGSVTPLGAAQHIDAAQSLVPSGPVTHAKAWIEMLHRYFASFVGLLIVIRLVWSVQLKEKLTLPVVTFVWVCVQGAFGAFTVTMKLFPAIVTLHLLGGMVLLMLLALQLEKPPVLPSVQGPASAGNPFVATRHFPYWRRGNAYLPIWLIAAFVCVWLQIALGGWVSTNYAVLACTEFPTCLNGDWMPTTSADWRTGFTLWRELGTASTTALTAIHLTHRAMAIAVLIAISGLILQLKKYPKLRYLKIWLMLLLTLQIMTGISNVVFSWPLLAAVMHTGGAAALVLVLTRIGVIANVIVQSATPLSAHADISPTTQGQTSTLFPRYEVGGMSQSDRGVLQSVRSTKITP